MTLFDNRTVVNTAAAAGDWTSVKNPTGGGLPTFGDFPSDPNPVFGSNCVGIPVNVESAGGYVASGTLNFTTNPEIIYAWILPLGVIDTFANGGIHIILHDGTNTIGFNIGGSDKSAFRHEGESNQWQCMVLDTSLIPTQFTTANTIPYAGNLASLNLGAITGIGAGATCLAKAKGGNENTFFDIIRRGRGGITLIEGEATNPGTFLSASNLDASNEFASGIIRDLGAGLYGIQGKITIGSSSVNTYFKETNAVINFESRYVNTSSYAIEYHGTNSNTDSSSITLGTKVGTGDTATGKDGVTFIANPIPLSASTVEPSASFFVSSSTEEFFAYGTTVRGFQGGVTLSRSDPSGSTHEWIGNDIVNSNQADVGYSIVRNSTFNDYGYASGSALLWDSQSINIKNSSFTGNTFAIQFLVDSTGSAANEFDNLTFSQNTFDLLNASNFDVTASIVGGTSGLTVLNEGTSTTLQVAQSTVTLTGLYSGSEVRVYDVDTGIEINGVEDVGVTGEFSFTDDVGNTVYIVIHAITYEYILIDNYVVPSSNTSIPIEQVFDRNYNNPV
ncbi:MAG: hypothetical protein VW683_00215 [Betaproteobacteria bacterium]